LLTPFGDAVELAEMFRGGRLRELRGAAHGLMVEQPGAFNTAVLEFLRDVDARLAIAT
jgi:pimeloyl-ACP methyl ester carboxylesterase